MYTDASCGRDSKLVHERALVLHLNLRNLLIKRISSSRSVYFLNFLGFVEVTTYDFDHNFCRDWKNSCALFLFLFLAPRHWTPDVAVGCVAFLVTSLWRRWSSGVVKVKVTCGSYSIMSCVSKYYMVPTHHYRFVCRRGHWLVLDLQL